MQRSVNEGVPLYRFPSFEGLPLRHVVLTRHGGVSVAPFESLNLSISGGDDPAAVDENVRRAYRALGAPVARGVKPWMVHSSRTRAVDDRHAGQRMPPCDGLVTTTRELPLTMTFGDCQPLLVYDPVRHALALGHAGWRGTLRGMALSLVEALRESAGSDPADLRVGLGPAIGACCYEVGADVAAQARSWPGGARWLGSGPTGKAHFNLSQANRDLFESAGVPAAQIEDAGICTACRTDDFFSYRKEKPATGRFAVLAMLE